MKLSQIIIFLITLLLAAESKADESPEIFAERFYNTFYQERYNDDYGGFRGAVRFVERMEPFLEKSFYELMRESALWDLSNRTFGFGNGLDPLPQTNITQVETIRKDVSSQSCWVVLKISATGFRRRSPVSAVIKVFLRQGGEQGWLITNILQETSQGVLNLKNRLGNVPLGGYPVRSLSPDELKTVRSELSGTIITDQSFSFAGTDTIYTTGDKASLLLATKSQMATGEESLRLRWRDLHGRYYELTSGAKPGPFSGLNTVAFADFNNDGLGPDILTISNCDDGNGEQSSVRIFFCQRPYEYLFKEDSQLMEYLSDKPVRTLAETESAVRIFYSAR